MLHFIKAISARGELWLVLLTAFGYFVVCSTAALLAPAGGASITEAGLQGLVVYELITFTLVAGFLSLRGWTRAQLGIRVSPVDTVLGFVLVVVIYAAMAVLWPIAAAFFPQLDAEMRALISPGLSLATIVAASIVNPVFEEVFVCGYLITALQKTRSVAFAVNASVAIRLAYHLYQGPGGVVGLVPVGLVFAHWFAKTRRLWPVVVAHALLDLVALAAR